MIRTVAGGITPFDFLKNPYPNGIIQPPGRDTSFQTTLPGQSIRAPLPDNPNGYVQQWNFNLQREIGEGFMVDMAYAGAKGTHLLWHGLQLNQLPDQFLSLGTTLQEQVTNPFFGLITSGELSTPTI